jgi:hypothetical protein
MTAGKQSDSLYPTSGWVPPRLRHPRTQGRKTHFLMDTHPAPMLTWVPLLALRAEGSACSPGLVMGDAGPVASRPARCLPQQCP